MFEAVNGFYRQMMSGDGGKAAIALSSEFTRSMQMHFDEEYALMSKHGYVNAAPHRA